MSPSTSQLQAESHSKEVATILRLLLFFNFFFAPVKDGLAPLVSVFLVVGKGWDAGSAGIVWFTRDISALICQTFAGAFIDSSENKRLLLVLATVAASVAATSMVISQNFFFMIAKSVVEGMAITFIQPCKCSMVLGLIGQEQFDQVSKANEMVDHAGSFVFIVVAGALAYVLYPDVVYIFYIIGGAGLIATLSLVLMPLSIKEDDYGAPANGSEAEGSRRSAMSRTRSRIDQQSSRNLTEGGEVKPWTGILKDKNIVLFASSVFFFHLGNAAVMPLLSQVLAFDSGRAGLPYTCANVAVAQLTSILATWGMGHALEAGVAYKIPLVIGYAFAVPVRCILIVLLMKYWPNSYAMLATQLFDGIGAGVFGLSLATLTRALTAGTGRFSFTLGIISTVHMIGAALSNLVGGFIVDMASYEIAFVSLGIMGIASVFLGMFIHVKGQEGEKINPGSKICIDKEGTGSGSDSSDDAIQV